MIATQSVRDAYGQDHDRLDALFAEYRATKRTDYDRAKECFKEFKFGLQRHIVWEEQILFPLFERKTGMFDGGPTAVMRAEHRQIADRLEAIHQKVRARDPETDREQEALLAVLTAHNQKEETVLYPMLDRLATLEERALVFDAMERVPQEVYRACCGQQG
jgi:iron-sulfur cluster repair protein YtfE (RIC family)